MTTPKNIIVRMPNWIGDAVMAAPVLQDLKKHFPEAKLSLLCQGGAGQLFSHDPHVDEIILFKKPSRWIHHLQITPFIENLRKGAYDTGLLLTNSLSSAWWLYRGHVKPLLGFGGRGRNLMLDVALPYPKNMETQHLITTYKSLLKPLGVPLSDTKPKLYLLPQERAAIKESLRNQGVSDDSLLVGINPGAAFGSAKCWLPERFQEVSKELLKDPKVWILLFGDAKGRELTDKIASDLGPRVLNLAGKTNLRELMAYIAELNVLLTNDSGPMHIASALETPLVALFGSTNDTKTGPVNKSLVIHKHVECSPCYKRECPIDFRCMTRIHSDEVVEGLKKYLYPH